MSRGKLVLRVYALTAAIAVSVMIALLLLPRFVGSPRYLEPQAALVQNMVDRLSMRDSQKLTDSVDRISKRLRGNLTLFDTQDRMVRTTVAARARGSDRSRACGARRR